MASNVGATYSAAVQRATALPVVQGNYSGKVVCTVATWAASLGYPGSTASGARQYLRNTGLRAAQIGGRWPAFTLAQHKYLVQHAPAAALGDATAQAALVALCSMAHMGMPGTPTTTGKPAKGTQVLQPVLPGKVGPATRKGGKQAKGQAQRAAATADATVQGAS